MVQGHTVRHRFPALSRRLGDRQVTYADGPAGTQVPEEVVAAMSGHLRAGTANHGGAFVTSRETDAVHEGAREAIADLFGAAPDEIAFGQNMTSLNFALSRALARTWQPGDNVVVTRLDHDANVWPWVLAARDTGVEVRFADFDPARGCALDTDHLASLLDERTRHVAVTKASNALGTIVDVAAIAELAHAVGARCSVDAVHFAPHGLIDAAAWGCDFLLASAYKFFGPHTGCLYGRSEQLASVEPYKLRPAPDDGPGRWETGTQSFESLAGVTAAVDYLASLGTGATRRERIETAMGAIAAYEATLSDRFLAGLAEMPGVELHGAATSSARVPTFAVEVAGKSSHDVAAALGRRGVFVWSGDYYAVEVMARLGKPDGLVRVGFVHYNTAEDVDRVLEELAVLTPSA